MVFLIAKFIYKNIKNASTNLMLFEFNYKYYFYIFLKKI